MIQNGVKSSTENTELPLQIIKLSFPHKKRKKERMQNITLFPLSSQIVLVPVIHQSFNSKPSTLQVSLSTNEAIRVSC